LIMNKTTRSFLLKGKNAKIATAFLTNMQSNPVPLCRVSVGIWLVGLISHPSPLGLPTKIT